MSSTAIVVKLMSERLELESEHGKRVMGVLLFQDLAVVPLLVLIPALGSPPEVLLRELGLASAQGGRADHAAAGGRPARDALVADAGGAAQERRAVRAEPAAGHAGAGLADRAGRPVAGAGRLHRRHPDLGDRVQAPGGGRHPALPRRAAGPVLHHHRHAAGLAAGVRALGAGAAAGDGAGAVQAGAGDGAGARCSAPPTGVSLRTGLYLAQAGEFGFVLLALAQQQRPGAARSCSTRSWPAWCCRCWPRPSSSSGATAS